METSLPAGQRSSILRAGMVVSQHLSTLDAGDSACMDSICSLCGS